MSRAFLCVAALIIFAGARTQEALAQAQASQPIYLQYDGFVKNKDGTLTLSFGYFNTNHIDVEIEPGVNNAFTPGAADRNQPTRFLTGRHRFACSMIVPGDFDGKIQWTVRIAGLISTTTVKTMDPLYELELASAKKVINGLDSTKAPKFVCVNRAPAIQVINPLADINAGGDTLAAVSFTVRLDQDLALNGSIEDDGLPRGGKPAMAWKKISGPGEVSFSDSTRAITRARFAASGAYEIELSASDSELSNSVRVKVTVSPPEDKRPD